MKRKTAIDAKAPFGPRLQADCKEADCKVSSELMATLKANHANATSKVKGPLRCHKCQLMCRDAEHYLNHKCEPRPR